MRKSQGFTLVELLVVIGIIAVLIAILLPTLSAVQRQATAVKCSTQLREMGNAFQMYAHEYKGYLPVPRQWTNAAVGPYEVHGLVFYHPGPEIPGEQIAENPKWWHFVAKYLSKGAAMAQTSTDADLIKKGIWWCPSFEGYPTAPNADNLVGGVNRNYVGYGMNWWPKFSPDDQGPFNANGFPSGARQVERFSDPLGGNSGGGPAAGTWYKLSQYKNAGERALLADSRYWYLEARGIAQGVEIPGQRLNFVGEYSNNPVGRNQTMYDFYRHGKHPEVQNADPATGFFRSTGGKVAYNILYADGHVETETDRESGYLACRMRFPD